jgi:2-polyprenyl-3-methyl-5-hydroxy-6-metoxy-1,4-benzoquinol methylase
MLRHGGKRATFDRSLGRRCISERWWGRPTYGSDCDGPLGSAIIRLRAVRGLHLLNTKTHLFFGQLPRSPGRGSCLRSRSSTLVNQDSTIKLLVAIASYGRRNDFYLAELVKEYRSMPYGVDIVVVSNIPRQIASDVQVLVGTPNKDPWSLPFAHKRVLAERLNEYDLFIYSEDDILIQQRNVTAFLKATKVLHEDEVAGFVRSEEGRDGETYYPDFHGCHHWNLASIRQRGGSWFASFTNDHAGCYMLTHKQLRRAVDSGGFLVPPHEGRHDLACTASTDPYTQCGLKKLICASHLEDFVVRHLSNRYAGTWMSLNKVDFDRQLGALLRIGCNGHPRAPLFEVETRLPGLKYSKSYYEPASEDIAALIPLNTQTVLSVGCGWGAMEERLVKQGLRVAAIPMDPIIGSCAAARGIEMIEANLRDPGRTLGGRKFDCVLLPNVLHLVEEPVGVLSSLSGALSKGACLIATVPNLFQLPILWRRLRRESQVEGLENFEKSGAHVTSHGTVRRWFARAGLVAEKLVDCVPARGKVISRAAFGLLDPLLSSDIIAVARRD